MGRKKMHTTALSYGASGGRPFTTPAFHKVVGKHREETAMSRDRPNGDKPSHTVRGERGRGHST